MPISAKKLLLLSLIFLSFSSHASETRYTYVSAFNCRDTGVKEHFKSTDWLSITGFQVGPSQREVMSLKERILKPFASDGCSWSPDKLPGWKVITPIMECCVEHDLAYWIGGTELQKDLADKRLEMCIDRKGFPFIGKVYRTFVDLFGSPKGNHIFRWGFGWNQKRRFSPLVREEMNQVFRLYNASYGKVRRAVLDAEYLPIQSHCNTKDVSLNSPEVGEYTIYNYLNQTLQREDQIEWAELKDDAWDRNIFLVKLQGCAHPLRFTYWKKTLRMTVPKNSCL